MTKLIYVIGLALLIVLGVATRAEQSVQNQPPVVVSEPVIDERAAKIDAYFAKRNMPLAGYGARMVKVSDQYGYDWRLLAAIAVREQSGGLRLPYNCPNRTKNYNVFGWASARVCFTSFNQAIDTVGMKLGTLSFYKGKSTFKKLQTYNPPSVVPTYAQEVMRIMEQIAPNEAK